MRSSAPRPGWWQASDGQWYPPELHPEVRARVAAMLGRTAPPATGAAPSPATPTAPSAVTPAQSAQSGHVAPVATPPVAMASPATAGATSTGATSTAVPAAGRPPGSLPRPDGSERAVPPVHRLAVPPEAEADTAVAPSGPTTTRTAGAPGQAPPPTRAKRWATTATIAAVVLGGIVLVTRGADRRSTPDGGATGSGVARAASSTSTVSSPVTVITVPPPTTVTTAAPAAPAATPTSAATPTPTAAPATTGPTVTTTAPPTTGSAPATTLASVRDVAVFQLTPGNCIDQADLTERPVTTVRVVPCELSHTHEVYATTAYSGSDTYEADRLARFADGFCSGEFARYVGIEYARSKYYFVQIVPTQDSWTRNADRDIVCAAFLEGGRLTGSVKGLAE